MAVMNVTFASQCLCRYVDFTVILPVEKTGSDGETKDKPEKFKTLYLLHGMGGNHHDWLQYSLIRELACKYDLAVVMPSGENSFYLDQDVLGRKYGSYIGEELITYTRKMFPLSDKKEDTFIGGLSMGGFGAVHTAFSYPEVFSKAFGLSSAFITNRIQKLQPGETDRIADYSFYSDVFGELSLLKHSKNNPEELVRIAKRNNQTLPGIMLACGTSDFLLSENREFAAFLQEQKADFIYKEDEGAHDFKFWNAHLEEAVLWLLEGKKE